MTAIRITVFDRRYGSPRRRSVREVAYNVGGTTKVGRYLCSRHAAEVASKERGE